MASSTVAGADLYKRRRRGNDKENFKVQNSWYHVPWADGFDRGMKRT